MLLSDQAYEQKRQLYRVRLMNELQKLFITILLIPLMTVLAHAADITKIPGKNDDPDLILISGEITPEDEKTFKALALSVEFGTILFDSPGGSLRPALEIGKTIRIKGFATAVINSECASACALAWLAGQPRYLSKTSNVGFHAAYTEGKDGTRLPAGVGNALVGAYLNTLGLNERVVEYVTTASPDKIRWLSKANAKNIGIDVSMFADSSKARANFNLAIKNLAAKPPDLDEAIRLYRLAANDGFAGAQNNLGDLYEDARGVAKNNTIAMYWYTRAAERGEPAGYLSISTLLSESTKEEAVLIEALKFGYLAYAGLPAGNNRKTATATIIAIENTISLEAQKKALDLAKAWEPLYQEKYLMSDTPNAK